MHFRKQLDVEVVISQAELEQGISESYDALTQLRLVLVCMDCVPLDAFEKIRDLQSTAMVDGRIDMLERWKKEWTAFKAGKVLHETKDEEKPGVPAVQGTDPGDQGH